MTIPRCELSNSKPDDQVIKLNQIQDLVEKQESEIQALNSRLEVHQDDSPRKCRIKDTNVEAPGR